MARIARWLSCLVLVVPIAAFGVETVRFPVPEFEGDHRYDYATQVLQLALSKSGVDYRIEPAAFPMNQERQVLES